MSRQAKYKTIAQAARAAQALGIKSSTEHRKKCARDPLLPYSPEKVYVNHWEGWPAFLGTQRKRSIEIPSKYYATYSQAKRAVRWLRIKTKTEYLMRYKQDQKLPANPQKVYCGYWKSWESFLSDVKQANRTLEIYKTLTQARRAAQALGPKNAREYIKIRHLDTGLPSNPSVYYKNWKSWHHFLGTTPSEDKFYKTLQQASVAARALNISSARDYVKRYRLDNKLPSTPYQVYANWLSWNSFLGN